MNTLEIHCHDPEDVPRAEQIALKHHETIHSPPEATGVIQIPGAVATASLIADLDHAHIPHHLNQTRS